MELWTEVRRRVLTGQLSQRTACREYSLGWWTLKKILALEQQRWWQDQCRSIVRTSSNYTLWTEIWNRTRRRIPQQRDPLRLASVRKD